MPVEVKTIFYVFKSVLAGSIKILPWVMEIKKAPLSIIHSPYATLAVDLYFKRTVYIGDKCIQPNDFGGQKRILFYCRIISNSNLKRNA